MRTKLIQLWFLTVLIFTGAKLFAADLANCNASDAGACLILPTESPESNYLVSNSEPAGSMILASDIRPNLEAGLAESKALVLASDFQPLGTESSASYISLLDFDIKHYDIVPRIIKAIDGQVSTAGKK